MFRAITKQLRKVRNVIASVRAVAADAAAVLDPKLQSFVADGESFGGFLTIQLIVARWLGSDQDRLLDLERAHRDALRELKQRRLRRDDDLKSLYGGMLRIRKTFEDAFGAGTAPVFLGLDPGLGDVEPIVLVRYAHETIGVLSDPELETPPPVVLGLWESPLQYAEQVRELLSPVEADLDEVDAQKKEVDKALKVKSEAQEEVETRLRWSTQFFEALLYLAGLDFHAERLRIPEGSRTSGDKPPPKEPESPEDSPDDGASGGPSEEGPPEDDPSEEDPAERA